ncbi:hypothetical protein N5C55_18050 [Pseudomonas otitidis]|uniref:hypothetical protein n=1 Tax=Metapseudomonas otitidis TaxID=319939 RepID=UPI002449112D|nr:hypothetical protein [Pseudomonas otitidis]MDH1105647.1 hypothetical protein [Pseudomonas otitidis]MDH1160078.1 hypothetical protein [Pseudomonas otitidis]MDH1164459.1 hypothetical protein [Pseudomonas otitidis]
MLLNSATLNSGVLNGSGRKGRAPVIIRPADSTRWRLRLVINGLDLSNRLTGSVTIDREAGAARVLTLNLVPEAGPVDLDALTGKPASLWRQRLEGAAVVAEQLRFVGVTLRPRYNPASGVLTITASCDLQNRVELMTREQIDALVPGTWAAGVFGEFSSHWQYAQDRASTRPQHLDCAPDGTLRVTPWAAAAVPHFVFPANAVIDGSLDVQPADASQLVNQAEVVVECRFTRLRHREHRYEWSSPTVNFCAWYVRTYELPTHTMLTEALEQADWDVVGTWSSTDLPPDLINPCGMGGAWYNSFTADPHMLSFGVSVARRTAQTLTEKYTLTLKAAGSVAAFGERPARERYSDDVEYDSRSWETLPANTRPAEAIQDDLGDWIIDKDDGSRRQDVLSTALSREWVEILDSHRRTRVVFGTPITDDVFDTVHTVRVEAMGTRAQGRLARVQEEWNIDAGSEIATLEIAISRGGNAIQGSPLVPPARPRFDLGAAPPAVTVLATQLGGDTQSPPYREELDGFAGNYSVILPGSEQCPRRLQITTPDIEAAYRDPSDGEATALYLIDIPTDELVTEAL